MPDDKLAAIREAARSARDLDKRIADLTEMLELTRGARRDVVARVLPELMMEAGVKTLGLEAEGNLPAYDFTLRNYARANVAASWEPERRAAGFEALERAGAGDLIKTVLTVEFGRGEVELARDVQAQLSEEGRESRLSMDVPHQTLSAWLREAIARGQELPPLELIGGEVGQIVEMKPRRDR